jgi:hypothetical protein
MPSADGFSPPRPLTVPMLRAARRRVYGPVVESLRARLDDLSDYSGSRLT